MLSTGSLRSRQVRALIHQRELPLLMGAERPQTPAGRWWMSKLSIATGAVSTGWPSIVQICNHCWKSPRCLPWSELRDDSLSAPGTPAGYSETGLGLDFKGALRAMSSTDDLGMDRAISRRDFVHGAALAGMAAAWPAGASPPGVTAAGYYPPRQLGLRGSHPGSFEAAHALRDQRSVDVSAASRTGERYDLVVVGGGLSGLAAAHFFLKSAGAAARVLILENHDDFGGHAKRNELLYGGKLLAINGGTLEIESPERYNRWARQVLDDIGVDLERYTRSIEPIRSCIPPWDASRAFLRSRDLRCGPAGGGDPGEHATSRLHARPAARHADLGDGPPRPAAAAGSEPAGLHARTEFGPEKSPAGAHQLPPATCSRSPRSIRRPTGFTWRSAAGCFRSGPTHCRPCSPGKC